MKWIQTPLSEFVSNVLQVNIMNVNHVGVYVNHE